MGTAAAVFETTTNAIVAAIENGAGKWCMPWSTIGVEFPVNPTTAKRYRGGNTVTPDGATLRVKPRSKCPA